MKGRRRSESISSSSSSSTFSSSSNGRSLSLHQAKSLDSLDRDEMSSDVTARSGLPAVPSWKQRRDYQRLGSQHPTTSTLSSCESGESSSCWSRSDGTTTQSSRSSMSSSSLFTGDTSDTSSSQSTTGSVRQRPFQYHQLNSHPKQRPTTGNDCNMLAIFSCCLDNRRQHEVSRSTSRWTETPEYGNHTLAPSCSSDCKSWDGSSSDHHSSLHEMGHRFSSHGPASDGPLIITKVPNQRYINILLTRPLLCVCFRHFSEKAQPIHGLMRLTYHFKIDSLFRPLPLPSTLVDNRNDVFIYPKSYQNMVKAGPAVFPYLLFSLARHVILSF